MNRNIIKNKELVERTIRDQLILVPLKTGTARLDALYTLNDAASLLWKAIDGQTTEDTLVTRLLTEYEVCHTNELMRPKTVKNG